MASPWVRPGQSPLEEALLDGPLPWTPGVFHIAATGRGTGRESSVPGVGGESPVAHRETDLRLAIVWPEECEKQATYMSSEDELRCHIQNLQTPSAASQETSG